MICYIKWSFSQGVVFELMRYMPVVRCLNRIQLPPLNNGTWTLFSIHSKGVIQLAILLLFCL